VTDLRLADVVSALVATRDRMQEKVGHANVAIEALGKLLDSDAPGPVALAPAMASAGPEARRALPAATVSTSARKLNGAPGPRTSVCRNERCRRPGRQFRVKGPGRAPHYCSDACRTAAEKDVRAAIESGGAKPADGAERRRMPRADRPVEDEELDSLLERGKRGAA
jgi:hypothetical protein